MTQAETAAQIAASIDPSTIGGHNLRALLLRLLDGEEWNEPVPLAETIKKIRRLKLIGDSIRDGLTPLGCQVGALLRPKPWGVIEGWNFAVCADGTNRVDTQAGADELTTYDLREAKQYRTEAP